MPPIMTHVVYKVYDIQNKYLGNLRHVSSDLNTTQDINTAGNSITITAAAAFDVAPLPLQPIETEDGQPLMTEAGEVITTDSAEQIVGMSTSLIKAGNGIVAWEYNSQHPNGVVRFNGYISQWKLSTADNQVTMICINSGVDLDQYLVRLDFAVDRVTNTANAQIDIYGGNNNSGAKEISYVYTGGNLIGTRPDSAGVGITIAAQNASSPVSVTVALVESVNGAALTTLVDSASFKRSATIQVTSTTPTNYVFQWPSYVYQTGMVYSFTIYATGASGTGALVSYQSGGNTIGTFVRWTGASGATTSADGLYLTTYFAPDNTYVPFANTDPASIVRQALTNYNTDGGLITFSNSTVALTGISNFSINFQTNTILEVINDCLAAAPANWYWYVDAANVFYFLPASTTADHTFVRGIHIKDLDISETIEGIKNVSYFTGGNTGSGNNLFVKQVNTTGLMTQRRGLARNSNNNVIDRTSGLLLAQSVIDENNSSKYPTHIEILASTYDTSTIKLGQMVQFRGWGIPLIDSLLLMIMNITYTPDSVILTLGQLMANEGDTVESLKRTLNQVQTIANPNQPS